MKLIILLSLFISCSLITCAQKFEIENKFHIKQDNKSIVFHVLDTDESQLKKYSPEKTYYWFKAQKVLNTQGGSSGSLLNGAYEAFYKNNQLAEKGSFKKGLKHGAWKYWNDKGMLILRENWNKGTQTGKQVYYSAEGAIRKTIICKSRQTQIIAQDTTIVKSRKSTVTTVRDSIGNLVSQTRFVHGLADGYQISRNPDGTITKTNYKMGVLVPEKVKSEKTKKNQEHVTSEKKSFKEKARNFAEKLKFWKKFKQKKQTETPGNKKEKKAKADNDKNTSSESREKKKRKTQ